jgi:hypothetical protein
LPVFLLRLLQKVNGAQCQQLSLAVLLAWLEPSYQTKTQWPPGGCRQGGPPGRWSDLAFVWAKPRRCSAFLGPGAPQGESLVQPGNLANSVALEPVALVLLAPFIQPGPSRR